MNWSNGIFVQEISKLTIGIRDCVISSDRSYLKPSARNNNFPSNRKKTDHDINIKPLTDMPRNMAVKRPNARIIRHEFHDDISRVGPIVLRRLQQLHVPSLHVALVDSPVPLADTVRHDVKIVPVQMHGVHDGALVLEHDADGVVVPEVGGVADFVHVPLRVVRVGGVARVGEVEEGETGACLEWVWQDIWD